jgi:hypothetical protein
VDEYTKLATLNKEESTYVPFHARIVKAQRCQKYVLEVMRRLVQDDVIKDKVWEHWRPRFEKSVLTKMKEAEPGSGGILPSAADVEAMLRECEEYVLAYAQQHGLDVLEHDTCLE